MACQILIKNLPNSWSTGDVLGVFPDTHQFGRMEDKAKFIAAGGTHETWPRHFVIVTVSDANVSDYEYLMDEDENEQRMYYLEPQGQDSPYYAQLLADAKITTTKAILDLLVRTYA